MRLFVVNASAVAEEHFRRAVGAIEHQIVKDFAPIWGVRAELRPFHQGPASFAPPPDLACDAIVFLVDATRTPEERERYKKESKGVPVGLVPADAKSEAWTVALSSELLERLVDPNMSLFVLGPPPANEKPEHGVMRPYEVCAPVRGSSYEVDAVNVANFVTPRYFAMPPRPGTPAPQHPDPRLQATNFLDEPLPPFGLLDKTHCHYVGCGDTEWKVAPPTMAASVAAQTSSFLNPRVARAEQWCWPACPKTGS